MTRPLVSDNKGFTLLEIVIAITIMAALSYLTAVSIRNSIDTKAQVQRRVDISSEIRTALKVIESDIKSAFNYNNFNYDLLVEIKKEQTKSANPNNPTGSANAPAAPPPPPSGWGNVAPKDQGDTPKNTIVSVIDEYLSKYKKAKDQSQFLGAKDSLHFTSINHVRRFADAQESDQMEVGYYLAECRDLLEAEKRSQCLWRRESPFVDDKVDQGGGATVLIENVKVLSFAYKTKEEIENDTSEWRESWFSSEERGDATTKGKFPDVVRVSIEAEIQGRSTKDVIFVPLDFPNNKEPSNETNPIPNAR